METNVSAESPNTINDKHNRRRRRCILEIYYQAFFVNKHVIDWLTGMSWPMKLPYAELEHQSV